MTGSHRITIIMENALHRINEYEEKIEKLSYDDQCRRENASQIRMYAGMIDESMNILRELFKVVDDE